MDTFEVSLWLITLLGHCCEQPASVSGGLTGALHLDVPCQHDLVRLSWYSDGARYFVHLYQVLVVLAVAIKKFTAKLNY